MTENQCKIWIKKRLPIIVKSKKGKLQYPFKSLYVAQQIEEYLGKELYKLLNDKQNGTVTLTKENAKIFIKCS